MKTRLGLLCGLGVVLCLAGSGMPRAAPVRAKTDFKVRIFEPAQGAYVFGRTRIVAEISTEGEVRIESVEFRVGEEIIFVDDEAPYQCVHEFGEEPRSWIIHAVARSADGRMRQDTIVTRKIEIDFLVEVNRVILNAVVISEEEDNRYILDLARDAFVLQEDGVPQEVIDFYLEQRPVSVALLLDTSGSLKNEMPIVHAAASGFVEALGEGDRGMVIEFSDKVFLLQDLTDRHALLLEAIQSTEALGPTAMYDALLASLRKMSKVEGRKAIVVLTDGEDTSSQTTYDSLLERVQLSEVIIYSIGLGSSVLDVALRSRLKEIARVTGGRAFFPGKAEDLEETYRQVINELLHQYYLTYAPTNQNWDGGWRKISLKSKDRKLKVRTRAGYYGVRPGSG
ncbi:MAG: VWA domain-containing protein [Acidobacteriota bacterium]